MSDSYIILFRVASYCSILTETLDQGFLPFSGDIRLTISEIHSCLLKPKVGPYSGPDESSQQPYILFLRFIVILSSHLLHPSIVWL
jgi:hypothetical protein